MSASVDGTVLIVCAANVCRSPFAAFLLGRELPGLLVESAGVAARAGDALCRFTRQRITALPDGSRFVQQHVVRRLDTDLIGRADLILTASPSERSAVAVRSPEARTRTFTLVEAAHSAKALSETERPSTLAGLAEMMNARRGRVTLPPVHRGRWTTRSARFGIAIPDAHIGETQRHSVVYRSIEDAVGMFARAFTASASGGGLR
ncbi:hypothetical protein [Microbacterium sp. CIAB417]|uniref:arsenate reductase/protein-tyrosine-phosphatase family protein n=1 Tax=Microbacterium sp. CIAB417 TaxID=2860287 RepID=UPI001FAC68E8|nr:hypothetical protein [Microbacterium sp. CIAB417]